MNIFERLQSEIAEQAMTIDAFTHREGIEVLTETKGDIESLMDIALQKIGLGTTVFTPVILRGETVSTIDVDIVLETVENPTNNRATTGLQVPALDVCAALIGVLWYFQPEGGWSPLEFRGNEFVQSPWPGTIAYDTTFRTSIRVEAQDAVAEQTPPSNP